MLLKEASLREREALPLREIQDLAGPPGGPQSFHGFFPISGFVSHLFRQQEFERMREQTHLPRWWAS
jgi:hypothetical protein